MLAKNLAPKLNQNSFIYKNLNKEIKKILKNPINIL